MANKGRAAATDRTATTRSRTRASAAGGAKSGVAGDASTKRRSSPDRIVIESLTPSLADGRYPIKRVVGEPVEIEATIYAEGHDQLWCVVAHQPPDQRGWTLEPMV